MNLDRILNLLEQEKARQTNTISLIASENCCSANVRLAQGSFLTDKYAEGYPGRRYYNGCEVVDEIELIAIDAAKRLFGCEYANVQPHSGSQANQAIFTGYLKPGDSILAMNLDHGGHLTHGSRVNWSGKYFKPHHYGTDANGIIDMNEVADLARKSQPSLIIAGASAYSRIIDWAGFRAIADKVGAHLLADIAHFSGLIAGGAYPSPVNIAHFSTSSTHKVLRGPRGGLILSNDKEVERKIDSAVFPGVQGGPLMHVIAAKAVCFLEAMTDEYRQYTKQVVANAKELASKLEELGWSIVSGGTDCHLFNVDLTSKCPDLTGHEAANKLANYNIVVNKECIPNDKRSPRETSGIRIGTPSVTSRGMLENEMQRIAEAIDKILMDEPADDISDLFKFELR